MNSSLRSIAGHRLVAGLGKGGMARVYLAISQKQLGFTKLVVLKVLREQLDVDGELLAMFIQEAQLAARLNHPNVVQTYEAGEDDGRHYIAMEYLEGQALSSILTRAAGRFPLEAHLRVLCGALEGLQYAHDLTDYDGSPLGIVHRDVSPQNVFVTYAGQAKIIDFGIAKTFDSTRTSNGILKGKTGYMAPEQALSGAGPDRRTDVFAIGVMMWEALAERRFVPRGEDEMVALARRISGQDPLVRDVAPDAPPDLADICDKAMARYPADRYGSAAEMREAIEACLATRAPFGPRQMAQLLEETFTEERTRIRRLVDEQVKEAFQSRPIIDLHTEAAVTPSRGVGAGSVAGVSVDAAVDDAPQTMIVGEGRASVPDAETRASMVVPAPRRRRTLMWLPPVVLVALAVGLTLLRASGGPVASATLEGRAAASTVVAAAPPGATEPAPAPAPAVPSVTASVAVDTAPTTTATAPVHAPGRNVVPRAAAGAAAGAAPAKKNGTDRDRAGASSSPAALGAATSTPPEAAGLRPLDGNPWEKTK